MDTAMADFGGLDPGTGQKACEGKSSWPVFLLILAVVTSSSLSALTLYQLMTLRGEVEGLKSDICRKRQEGPEADHKGQVSDSYCQSPQGCEEMQKIIILRILYECEMLCCVSTV